MRKGKTGFNTKWGFGLREEVGRGREGGANGGDVRVYGAVGPIAEMGCGLSVF